MKETLQIPTPETLEALIGKELYDIWTSLCRTSSKSTIWNNYGTMEGKNGYTNINIAKAEKRCVPYTPKEQTIGFMVILGKDERAKFESLREVFSMRLKRYTMRRRLSTMGSGLCSN